MSTTRRLASLGQSLWLDTITRDMLGNGTLARYIAELDVTGLTSNPTIYDKAIGGSSLYDPDVAAAATAGSSAEETFFSLALDDLRRAADLFRPVHDRSDGVDGYVSLEVSPLLAFDTAGTEAQAAELHARADRPNLLIKIPGTTEGLPAIERSIFDGIPVNVTLLFSPAHALACAEAYTRGVERRLEAGRSPRIASVASLFISRWDPFTADRLPAELKGRLGLAIGWEAYTRYTAYFASERWTRLRAAGAHPQRLLFASTGTKDPSAPPTLYAAGLAAPDTVDTMPEETLLACGSSDIAVTPLAKDTAASAAELARFSAAGIDIDAAAGELQRKGADSFVASWRSLMERIERKAGAIAAR